MSSVKSSEFSVTNSAQKELSKKADNLEKAIYSLSRSSTFFSVTQPKSTSKKPEKKIKEAA